jgi:DNA modification methylase
MDEVKRVLTKDGTVWVNLGDTYGTKSGGLNDPESRQGISAGQPQYDNRIIQTKTIHKCLLLIPHRFAIGCIDRGWILRNDIIWAKPNGMPESVTDRFSKRHEFIFLFAKNKKYYVDLDGISEEHSQVTINRNKYGHNGTAGHGYPAKKAGTMVKDEGKNPGDVSDFWAVNTKGNNTNHYASYNTKLIDKPIIAGCPEGGVILDPFCGTGTTLKRAKELRRKYIGIEASEEYYKLALRSVAQKELF